VIYAFIIIHFVSDWILQPRSVAKKKSSSWCWLGVHVLMIYFSFLGFSFLYDNISHWYALVFALVHGLQDKVIWKGFERIRGPFSEEYISHNRFAEDWLWYSTIAVDQMLHLVFGIWLMSIYMRLA